MSCYDIDGDDIIDKKTTFFEENIWYLKKKLNPMNIIASLGLFEQVINRYGLYFTEIFRLMLRNDILSISYKFPLM